MNSELKYINLLAGLILTANICSGMLGPKIIDINFLYFNFSVTCGVIPFCIAFFCMDLYTNQYGIKSARSLSTSIAICNFILGVMIYLLVKIPPSHLQHGNSFDHSLGPMIRSFFVGSVATVISYYLNAHIFSKLLIYYNGKHLWLRCICATSFSELVYSFIFDLLYFSHQLTMEQILGIVLSNYGIKLVFELLSLPLTYFFVALLDKYENNHLIYQDIFLVKINNER